MEDEIVTYLTLYIPIAIFIIGSIGNSFVIAILTRDKFRKITLFRYLIVATVFDYLNVFMAIVDFNTDFFQINNLTLNCKIFNYAAFFIYQCSPWIMVISSIDRLLAVKYPFNTQFRLKGKFQALVVYIVFQVLALLNIPFYIYTDIIVDETNTTTCGPTIDSQVLLIMPLCNMFIAVIIPYIIIGTTSCMLGFYLIRQKKRFEHIKSNFLKERKLVKTLIAIDSFFLICYLPYSINQLINYFSPNAFYDSINNVTDILTYIYSASNIFILLASNQMFRSYFISLFCCA